jgi:hypothetical protein
MIRLLNFTKQTGYEVLSHSYNDAHIKIGTIPNTDKYYIILNNFKENTVHTDNACTLREAKSKATFLWIAHVSVTF